MLGDVVARVKIGAKNLPMLARMTSTSMSKTVNVLRRRLVEALSRSGESQSRIADYAGIGEATLSRWKSEEHPINIKLEKIVALAEALGIEPYQLLEPFPSAEGGEIRGAAVGYSPIQEDASARLARLLDQAKRLSAQSRAVEAEVKDLLRLLSRPVRVPEAISEVAAEAADDVAQNAPPADSRRSQP